MRMGGPEQHIGILHGKRLYKKVKKCLCKLTEALPQTEDRKKKCGGFDPNFCKDTCQPGTSVHTVHCELHLT
jgi:hypothetical protein